MLDRLRRPFREQGQDGYVLLLILITTTFLFISLSGILSLSLINLSSAKRTTFDTNALYAAEAGVDSAVMQIDATSGAYTGTNSVCPISTAGVVAPVQVFNDAIKGRGTYETCVVAGTISHEYILYVVGKVYQSVGGTTNPIATKRLRIVVEGSASGAYTLQTGPGGLIMGNSANISNGPVYVGGFLTMSNTASIGTAASPVGVNVANARCPSPPTAAFPTICGAGILPNPITLNNSAHIYGSVNANGQSVGTGMSNAGLVSSTGVTPPTLPDYDRTAQKTAATASLTGAAASCTSNGGTVTWPANVKITGNVTVSHNCQVLVSGNAWITGNFSMTQTGIIKPAATVTVQPVIMVDGSNGVDLANQSSIATNAQSTPVGLEFITFYSAAPCSPDCTTVTGTDLYNSQSHTTINIGNQGAAPGSVLYARWTELALGQGGSIGAILGQTIDLEQSGSLSFGSTVATGTYSYDVRYYEFY
jgi:hypothetical protein